MVAKEKKKSSSKRRWLRKPGTGKSEFRACMIK
jgi:hypothetical protein